MTPVAAGGPKTPPVRTSNSAPWQGHVTVVPSSSPDALVKRLRGRERITPWAFMPVFDPELMVALAAWRHLRSRCTTIHHMGFDTEGPQARGRSEKAIRTYLRSGIRLAFAPGVRNVDKLVPAVPFKPERLRLSRKAS